MATPASGKSREKLATLLTTNTFKSPERKASNSFSRSLIGVEPSTTGAPKCCPSSAN